MEYAPGSLVRHAEFALKLLGRNPAAGRGHEVHPIEPRLQRRGRLLKDRPGQRVDVRAAVVARVRLALAQAMLRAHLLALAAHDPVRVREPRQVLQAGVIIGEVAIEVTNGVAFHRQPPEADHKAPTYVRSRDNGQRFCTGYIGISRQRKESRPASGPARQRERSGRGEDSGQQATAARRRGARAVARPRRPRAGIVRC